MSKPIQLAVIALIALLLASAGIGVYLFLQNNQLNQNNQSMQSQIQGFQTKESELLAKAKKLERDQQELNDKISQKEKEREQAQQAYDGLKAKVDDLNYQITQAKQEKDDFKSRVDTIRRERDELMEKLRNQKEKIVEKIVEKPVEKIVYRDRPASGASEGMDQEKPVEAVSSLDEPPSGSADQYWAGVLKQRETLKLDLQKAQAELDQSALQVVELKKQNSDIQLELKNLTDIKDDLEKKLAKDKEEFESQMANERKEMERKLRYNEDLANSLSMEVAKAHTEQKDAVERAEKFKQDMLALQEQIKQLGSTKLALERTISQINQDKAAMQKRLDQTEGAIQGRIDEIWKIKQSLDQKISQLPSAAPNSASKNSITEVELPPIVVNPAPGTEPAEKHKKTKVEKKQTPAASKPAPRKVEAVEAKSQGTIISINEPNNFVIVDLGEGDSAQVGRKLTVMRDNKPVGALEIIQVRKDISAADIKDSNGPLRVGDTVRYN